jgi:hypothetical protein
MVIEKTISKYLVALIVAVTLILPLASVKADPGNQRKLVLFQGFILLAYFDDKYIEIKRFKPGEAVFYGYGWLNSDEVFISYQPQDEAEATAKMEVININTLKVVKLETIGGVGESHFAVNANRGEVIYNNENGISLIRINTKTNLYRIYDVNPDYCWAVFWVDDNTAGCQFYDKPSKKMIFKKYKLPSPEQIKKLKIYTELKWSSK